MDRLRLIHWNAEEAAERCAYLAALGYQVDYSAIDSQSLRALWSDPPNAIIIDLNRLPSQGRDLGLMIRRRKTTRLVPLIFVGGKEAKVLRVQTLLPDAHYTKWASISAILPSAINNPPVNPKVPDSGMAAYANTPLPQKLGIKKGSVVGLIGAPSDFQNTLGQLPENVCFRTDIDLNCNLTLWFVRTESELFNGMERMVDMAKEDGLWIIWPKNSVKKTGLSQSVVRKTGMDAGLVDYKISSIDKKWSGLRFAVKKP